MSTHKLCTDTGQTFDTICMYIDLHTCTCNPQKFHTAVFEVRNLSSLYSNSQVISAYRVTEHLFIHISLKIQIIIDVGAPGPPECQNIIFTLFYVS